MREARWAVGRTAIQRAMRQPAMRVWLDVGTREAGSADASRRLVMGVRALRDALVERGLVPGRELAYLEAAGATHHEAAWARRVAPMLEFLFPAG